MGEINVSAYARCPFYIAECRNAITCEGWIGDGKTKTYFESGEQKKKIRECYCDAAYKRCPVFRMLMRYKYPE